MRKYGGVFHDKRIPKSGVQKICGLSEFAGNSPRPNLGAAVRDHLFTIEGQLSTTLNGPCVFSAMGFVTKNFFPSGATSHRVDAELPKSNRGFGSPFWK